MSNEKKEFKVGDLVVVTKDMNNSEDYFDKGSVGKVVRTLNEGVSVDVDYIEDKTYWSNKVWETEIEQLKHYTPIEDLPLWESNHMYLNDEQQQALRKLLHRVQWDEEYAEKIDMNLEEQSILFAFYWCETEEGADYWNEVENQVDVGVAQQQSNVSKEDIVDKEQSKPNGGSSDYYKLTITRVSDGETFDCEMGDIIYSVFGGDFDLGNIVKACRRSYLATIGQGKQGAPIDYDMNKIAWFSEDFANRKG